MSIGEHMERLENAERITDLEELAADMWGFLHMRCRDCDRWVQMSKAVGTCRDAECKHLRGFADRIKELEVPL